MIPSSHTLITAAARCVPTPGSASAGGAVFLAETVGLARVPVCGNGICEIGERYFEGTWADGTVCMSDCGHSYLPCPATQGVEEGNYSCDAFLAPTL